MFTCGPLTLGPIKHEKVARQGGFRMFLVAREHGVRSATWYHIEDNVTGEVTNVKKALFIYNPNSGKELLKPKLSDVIDTIVKGGYEVTVYPTQMYKDAYRKVMTYTDTYDRIICSGGDGTLDEVVTGMIERGENVPIGYIPTGTTNDFANSLQIPKNLLEAAHSAVHGAEFACDVGKFNDDIFAYVAAFGLFTDVSYETKQELKNALGHFAYILQGATKLLDVPCYHLRVSYDEGVIEDEFILGMVTNSRSIGGFRKAVSDDVAFDDGIFEVTLIKMPKSLISLQEIITALLVNQFDTKYMYSFKTRKITFESEEEIAWTLDGEFGGDHKKVEIKNLQKAVKIIIPESHLADVSEEGLKARKENRKATGLEKIVEDVVKEIAEQTKLGERLLSKRQDEEKAAIEQKNEENDVNKD